MSYGPGTLHPTVDDARRRRRMNATPEPSGPLAEAILEAVVGRVCEGMVLSDAQGRLVIYNAQMEALTGYSRGEAEVCADFLKALYPEPEVHRRVLEGVY